MNTETKISMNPIGTIEPGESGATIQLKKGFGKGLTGLDGFSHVIIIWQFDKAEWEAGMFTYSSPYKSYSGELGVFASRGPLRPNGIALDICRVLSCDVEMDRLTVDWIDAGPLSPVLDIKPLHPSSDVVREVTVPKWCRHWPGCREASGEFDWASEFSF